MQSQIQKNLRRGLVLLFITTLLSCGSNNEGGGGTNTPQTGGISSGTINSAAWTMGTGDSEVFTKSNGTKVLQIDLWDSTEEKACPFDSRISLSVRGVMISVPIELGTTDAAKKMGAIAFVYPKGDTTYIRVANEGTVTVTRLTDDIVEGTVQAKDLEGNSVSGSFSVVRCKKGNS